LVAGVFLAVPFLAEDLRAGTFLLGVALGVLNAAPFDVSEDFCLGVLPCVDTGVLLLFAGIGIEVEDMSFSSLDLVGVLAWVFLRVGVLVFGVFLVFGLNLIGVLGLVVALMGVLALGVDLAFGVGAFLGVSSLGIFSASVLNAFLAGVVLGVALLGVLVGVLPLPLGVTMTLVLGVATFAGDFALVGAAFAGVLTLGVLALAGVLALGVLLGVALVEGLASVLALGVADFTVAALAVVFDLGVFGVTGLMGVLAFGEGLADVLLLEMTASLAVVLFLGVIGLTGDFLGVTSLVGDLRLGVATFAGDLRVGVVTFAGDLPFGAAGDLLLGVAGLADLVVEVSGLAGVVPLSVGGLGGDLLLGVIGFTGVFLTAGDLPFGVVGLLLPGLFWGVPSPRVAASLASTTFFLRFCLSREVGEAALARLGVLALPFGLAPLRTGLLGGIVLSMYSGET